MKQIGNWSIENQVDNVEYIRYFTQKYMKFIKLLNFVISSDIGVHYIKEEGCGIGSVAVGLNRTDLPIYFSDINKHMLQLCRHNVIKSLGHIRTKFIEEDITSKDKYYKSGTLVVTHGILDEFSDDRITTIVENYNTNENIVGHVHCVSLDKLRLDKRSLSVDEWRSLIKPYMAIRNECDLILLSLKTR